MTAFPRAELKVKVEEIDENLVTLLQVKWQALIDAQTLLVTFLRDYEKEMFWEHEVPVNSCKTANAVVAVGAAVLLFVSPPIGLAVGIGSGVAGAGIAAGDTIATRIKKSKLGYRIAIVKSAARELEEI